MVRTNQGGSVLSFIVVGVVLLAVFAGGAYAVRQYMRPAQELPAELPGERPQEKPQSEEKAPEQPADNQKDESSQKEAPAPQEESKPQPDTSHESMPSPGSDSGEHTALPETGPSQLLASLLAAGLLSATAISYLRSRRPGLSL